MSKTYREQAGDLEYRFGSNALFDCVKGLSAEADTEITRLTAERDAAREDAGRAKLDAAMLQKSAMRYLFLRAKGCMWPDAEQDVFLSDFALDDSVDTAIAKDKPCQSNSMST